MSTYKATEYTEFSFGAGVCDTFCIHRHKPPGKYPSAGSGQVPCRASLQPTPAVPSELCVKAGITFFIRIDTDFGLAWFGKAEAGIFKEKISTSKLDQSCSFQLLLPCNLRQNIINL